MSELFDNVLIGKAWVVSYSDKGDKETTETVFDNKDAADACFKFCLNYHDHVQIDECPVYGTFLIGSKAYGKQREEEPRYVTLLRAAHTLLHKQYHAGIVLNLLEETVFYDEAECDGNCLLNDIEYYFDEIGVEIPENERVNP